MKGGKIDEISEKFHVYLLFRSSLERSVDIYAGLFWLLPHSQASFLISPAIWVMRHGKKILGSDVDRYCMFNRKLPNCTQIWSHSSNRTYIFTKGNPTKPLGLPLSGLPRLSKALKAQPTTTFTSILSFTIGAIPQKLFLEIVGFYSLITWLLNFGAIPRCCRLLKWAPLYNNLEDYYTYHLLYFIRFHQLPISARKAVEYHQASPRQCCDAWEGLAILDPSGGFCTHSR